MSSLNRERLKQRGVVIYLAGSAELLMKRTAYDTTRPLLETDDRLGKIKSLLNEREPIYSELADYTVNVDKMSARQIVNKISGYLAQQ